MKRFYLILLLTLLISLGFATVESRLQAQEKIAVENNQNTFQINVIQNKLIVENLPRGKEGTLEIFSIVGIKVYSEKVKSGTSEYSINLPKGYYIVKIGNIVKKIAVK